MRNQSTTISEIAQGNYDLPVRKTVHRRLIAAFLASTILMASPLSARSCTETISDAVSPSVSAVLADISSMSIAVTLGFDSLMATLTKLANQGSNDVQNENQSVAATVDHERLESHGADVAQTRVEMAVQMVPSRTTCATISQAGNLQSTQASYRNARINMQTAGTSFSLNAPGTPGENGTLAALNWGWEHRCSTYADVEALGHPAGCSGASNPALKDFDITPMKSIFSAFTYKDSDFRQAALDSVLMLTEPAPTDAVRGSVLGRDDGRNIHVLRMRDITRMNLARDILQDAVAMRSEPDTAGSDGRKISRLSRLVELMAGTPLSESDHYSGSMSSLADQVQKYAVDAAGEPENANVQGLASKLTAQKMMLTEMLRMTEQMVAVAALNLAADVERNSRTSPTSRVLQR